ncbi:MAG: glycosyltransferase family 2 protein [Geobacteraceae bacterium]|nr:glycosyltransferase family 2 protein [Geobacteraceae bacterium]
MLQGKLEILIITYNRGAFLDKTLTRLSQSPFSRCKITILDNCSTDQTPNICNKYYSKFTNYIVVRHNKNIGGTPNYLRAVELSESPYTWILCDDDEFDFNDISDMQEALLSDSYDLIYVGSPNQQDWERGLSTTSRELLSKGALYHIGLSFFPSIIFRTELFDATCIMKGYLMVSNLYPQFEFIAKSVRENFRVYVAKRQVVIWNELNNSNFSPLFGYTAWVNCCRSISEADIRASAIDEVTQRLGFYRALGFWIAFEKHYEPQCFYRKIYDIFSAYNLRQKLRFFILLPLVFIKLPLSLLLRIRLFIYRQVMRRSDKDIPSVMVVTGR